MAVGSLIGKKVVGAVFLDRTPRGESVLRAGVGGLIHIAERVGRLYVAVSQESVRAPVELVAARLGNDVDDAARGLAIFRSVTVGKDLELLHGILRDRRTNTVRRIIDGICAVNIHEVAARVLTANV